MIKHTQSQEHVNTSLFQVNLMQKANNDKMIYLFVSLRWSMHVQKTFLSSEMSFSEAVLCSFYRNWYQQSHLPNKDKTLFNALWCITDLIVPKRTTFIKQKSISYILSALTDFGKVKIEWIEWKIIESLCISNTISFM